MRSEAAVFVIRRAQLAALAAAADRRLEPWLIAHLREHFAQQVARKTDADLRVLIEDAVRRGRASGLELPTSLCHYVDLCVLFGADFEQQPDLPWVLRALRDPRPLNRDARVALMVEHAAAWLAELESAAPPSE